MSGALLLNALLGISKGNSGGLKYLRDSIEAVIIYNAFPVVGSCGISLLGHTSVPAGNVISTLFLTVLKGRKTL